ncbi:MAG: hypothetical protein ACRD2X_10450 [Vicinamibacteraceae bacterium]
MACNAMPPPPLHEIATPLRAWEYNATEARFLALVILHSGVFLRRQYRAFCRAERGPQDQRLIRKLLAARHATVLPYGARERLYHVQAKLLYAALDRADDSHRKRPSAPLCAQRLLTLDDVLTAPYQPYLTSEADKAALFTDLEVPREVWPARTFVGRHNPADTTTRYFAEKFPLYHDPEQGVVFLFPHAFPGSAPDALETFLRRYLPLFRALPRVMVRYLHPASLPPARALRALTRFQRDPNHQLRRLGVDLRRYFTMRERLESQRTLGLSLADLDQHRLDRTRFQDSAYDRVYAAWHRLSPAHRYRALVDLDALPAARGVVPLSHLGFETHGMPYRYAVYGALPCPLPSQLTRPISREAMLT